MRRCLFALVGVVAIGACGNDKMHLHPDGVIGPAYWKPRPGEVTNWDIQVHAPFDFGTTRAMMIIDLWASVPAATTIEYEDGSSVNVPVGAQAQTIATLQARQTTIICRVGLGGVKMSDPDYAKFPAAAIGDVPTTADPDERYLDLSQRGTWGDIAFARLDLAKQIGCDGIEPYLADHDFNTTGFTEDPDVQRAWASSVALEVHQRQLSAGARNGSVPGMPASLAAQFDWLLVERCGEFGDCDTFARDFLNARKAVFAVDYNMTAGDETEPPQPQQPGPLCMAQLEANVQGGVVKDVALSSAFLYPCQ